MALQKVKITNPGPAPRVLYGGETNQAAILIPPGETVEGELNDEVIDFVKAQAAKVGKENEVSIETTGTAEKSAPPQSGHAAHGEAHHAPARQARPSH